jgi:hypothetical protein
LERDVGVVVPALEINEGLNIVGEVLGIDGDYVAWNPGYGVGNEEGKVSYVLPVSLRGDAFVVEEFGGFAAADVEEGFCRRGRIRRELEIGMGLFNLLAYGRRR